MAGERRHYPRVLTELPLEIVTEGGESACGTIRNLSMGGVEISCDRWCADRILPSGHQAFPGQPIHAQLRWRVKAADGTEKAVEAAGEIVVSRRLSQDEYRVGIHFLHFDGDSEQNLQDYVRIHAH